MQCEVEELPLFPPRTSLDRPEALPIGQFSMHGGTTRRYLWELLAHSKNWDRQTGSHVYQASVELNIEIVPGTDLPQFEPDGFGN